MNIDPVANWIVALTFIQLFGSAAWHKLNDMSAFQHALRRYQIAPKGWITTLSLGVLGLEALTVALLVVPDWRLEGALVAMFLLASYTMAMATNLLAGQQLADCGCHFGSDKQPVSWYLVIRNVILILIVGVLILPAGTRLLTFLDFATILFGVVLGPLLYAISNGLSNNQKHFNNG